MPNHLELEFCFRGDRTYIFGADIYNKIIEILRDRGIKDSTIDLSIHGISRTNIDLLDKQNSVGKNVKFALTYIDKSGNKNRLLGVENGRKIECRNPFQEEKIRDATDLIIDESAVAIGVDTGFSFIDNVLIANKTLLSALFPNARGKWYFTRLQLNKIVAGNFIRLKLVHRSRFKFKLAKTEIFINDDSVGFIFTSLVEE